jgi:hypothetical protein
MLNPSENLILQLNPETIEKGYLHRLIKAMRELENAVQRFITAEIDYGMEAAMKLTDLPLNELENMLIDALCIAAQSHQDAENERLRSTGGKG